MNPSEVANDIIPTITQSELLDLINILTTEYNLRYNFDIEANRKNRKKRLTEMNRIAEQDEDDEDG